MWSSQLSMITMAHRRDLMDEHMRLQRRLRGESWTAKNANCKLCSNQVLSRSASNNRWNLQRAITANRLASRRLRGGEPRKTSPIVSTRLSSGQSIASNTNCFRNTHCKSSSLTRAWCHHSLTSLTSKTILCNRDRHSFRKWLRWTKNQITSTWSSRRSTRMTATICSWCDHRLSLTEIL